MIDHLQQADIDNSDDVIRQVAALWKCSYKSTKSKYYPFDYLLKGSRGTFAIEVKCRTNKSTAYGEYMVCAHKLYSMMLWSAMMGSPSFLIVRWTDGVGFWKLPKDDLIRDGCRIDIGQRPGEVPEPCVFIPMEKFKMIKGIK